MTPQNWRAWEHYRECLAVGQFPDDPIVRQNAAILAGLTERLEREREDAFHTLLVTLLKR